MPGCRESKRLVIGHSGILHPNPTLLPYATTKGAIQNFTAGLAQLLAEKGIRANAVAPGPIISTFTGVRNRDRVPDAAVGAGDDGLFASKPAGASIGHFAMIGFRPHRFGAARHGLGLARKWWFCVFIHGAKSSIA
jgi:NAD(P)-dependent dehydrogenase (short-subunit alcohol dehydrogenase family)